MLHPIDTYAALSGPEGNHEDGRALRIRLVRLMIVLGAFVSFTSAGRLVAFHLVSTFVFWSFVPALQLAAVTVVLRVLNQKPWSSRALSLYLVGHGPWLLFLMAVCGVCLFVPNVYLAMTWMISHGVLPAVLLAILAWGGVLTWAFFRHGLAMTGRRAAAATALFYLLYIGAILGWFFATNQLQPQIFGVP